MYEPGNNKRLYIDKGIGIIKDREIGLAHLNTDFIYKNPDKTTVINDVVSLITVDLLSHKEIHKIVRFIYRDSLDRDLYIAEAKYYVGDGMKTINMTDVNKYLPDYLQMTASTFTLMNIDMSSAPTVDIVIKTTSYKYSDFMDRQQIFIFNCNIYSRCMAYYSFFFTCYTGEFTKYS